MVSRYNKADPEDAIPGPGFRGLLLATMAADSQPLQRLLYTGPMINLYQLLFAEPVRHFDYTWLRAVPPGRGTQPHMDSVFMNRGTLNFSPRGHHWAISTRP